MWPPSSSRNTGGGPSTPPPPLGYGIPPELGMFVVAPAAFHHPAVTQHHHVDPMILPGDPHNNTHASNATTALGVGVNVIPLLTASPCLNNPTGGAIDESDIVDAANRGGRTGGGGGAIHLWQTQQQQQHNFTPPHEVNYLKKAGESISFDQNVNLFNSSAGGGSGLGGGLSGAGTLTCQDCGNQAKKDCSHRRCRTCCRSRGFDCSTHVKSTWVPAARRRERQVMTATRPSGGGGGDGASSGSTSGAKKPRLITSQNTTTTSHTSASNTPPRSYETSSSHQDASLKERLPGQVRAPAVFKCVRVSAVDDGSEDEYAYQAVVKIGGHVFKGFLYDQGMESREGFPNLSDLHVSGGGGCSSSRHGGGGVGPSPNNPLLDPSEVYGASASNAAGGDGAGILGGSTFGNTIG